MSKSKHNPPLKKGDVVLYNREEWQVTLTNDCRAYIAPVRKKTVEITKPNGSKAKFSVTRLGLSISLNSELPIIKRKG